MRFRPALLFLTILLSQAGLFAQYYDTGEDPSGLRWRQIRTERFSLIYPESYSGEAQKFAGSLDNSFRKLSPLYDIRKGRYPVVIHNYTTFSNGYVAWAPKRMEIYPTPEQNSIPLDHIEQLTLHELTHIMQLYSLDKGLTRGLSLILGEQASALASGLVPMWMLEGGAVLSESLLSGSGRGRTPSFQKNVKALLIDGERNFSYDKILLGSYRHYVPDHYQYGYQMVAWGYSRFGQKMWMDALSYTGKFPFLIYPVSLSNIKNTGLSNSRLYRETMDTLGSIWKEGIRRSDAVEYPSLNPGKGKEYINYYSPVIAGRDSIIAIKTTLANPPAFVLVNTATGKEKRIHVPGDMWPWFLSGSVTKLVWVEDRPDPRWNNRDYSVIMLMDLKTGKVKQMTRQSRYMAAAISPDGRMVAASSNTPDNRNSLHIIDAFNSQLLDSVETPGNIYLQRPHWSASGKEVTFISLSARGEGVISYSSETGEWKTLVEPGTEDIQSACLVNDTLFYVGSGSGTDNAYLITPAGEKRKISNSRLGVYDISLSGNKILFSEYTVSGYNIASAPVSGSEVRHLQESSPLFLVNRFDTLRNPEEIIPMSKSYESKPYRKWMHPFRFHSWMPFYADIEQIQSDPTAITPGLTFLSQNTLSTIITSVGYEYSGNMHQLHTKLTWKGWLPVIESRIDYGDDPDVVKSAQTEEPLVINPGITFENSISLPLTFSSGKFTHTFYTSLAAVYQNDYIYLTETGKYDYGQTRMTARVYFANQHQGAVRDIYPRWSQSVDLTASFAPADNNIYGPLNSVKTAFFFPGFFRNHGIRLRYEADRQKPEKLLLYNRASYPRGYKNIVSDEIKFLSADYVMPFICPDLTIPGFFYLKRIRGGAFWDFAVAKDNRYLDTRKRNDFTEYFRSFGTEIFADFNILRIPFTISAGLQSAWVDINKPPVLHPLFRIDIYGMKIGRKKL